MISRKCAIKLTKFISKLIYYSGVYAVLNLIFNKSGIYIVFYHRLGDKAEDYFEKDFTVDHKSFEKQAKYLKSKYEVISMDDALEMLNKGCKITKKYMVLTFDDGYKDNFIYGYRIFKKLQLKPTIYLTANCIENQVMLWTDKVNRMFFLSKKNEVKINILKDPRTFNIKTIAQSKLLADYLIRLLKGMKEEEKLLFIEQLKENLGDVESDSCDLMLDWSQVEKMMKVGCVIGGHTMTHPILSKISNREIPCEIFESKLLIEGRINKPLIHFAYPNGKKCDYSDYIKEEVKKHYKSAVTTISGINNKDNDFYELKRIGLSYDMNLVALKVKILYVQIKQTFTGLVRW